MKKLTEEQVTQIVNGVLIKHLGVDTEKVIPTASLADDLGADSLDSVEIAMALEEQLGIEIPDEDMDSVTTVADVHRVVNQNLPK